MSTLEAIAGEMCGLSKGGNGFNSDRHDILLSGSARTVFTSQEFLLRFSLLIVTVGVDLVTKMLLLSCLYL